MLALPIFVISISVLIGSWLLRQIQSQQALLVLAETHGCQLPSIFKVGSFRANLTHKVRLIRQSYGDLFNDYYASKFERYGSTHAMLDFFKATKVVHSIDPANLQQVLINSFDDWTVYRTRRNALSPLTQNGVLLTDGGLWHRNRKLIYRRVNTFRSKDARSAEPDMRLLFKAVQIADGGDWTRGVDVSDLVRRLALDMSSRYLFGISADYQLSGIRSRTGLDLRHEYPSDKPEGWQSLMENYNQAWKSVGAWVTRRSTLGSKYWLADGIGYRRGCAQLRSFASALVAAAVRHRETHGVEDGTCLIGDLFEELNDVTQVREHVLELVIANQNMTGSVIEWTLAELGNRPDIYARIRREVLEKFGDFQQDHPEALMTWDRLKACTTLQNTISESLRCHPTVAMLSRTATKDTILPRGGGEDGTSPIVMAKGGAFSCNVYLMQRRTEEWGPDSWEWQPDRWIGRKMGPEYAPFGAGPRVCLGRQLSLTEISFVLARFAQEYEEISGSAGADNIAHEFRGILVPKHGVHLDLKRARCGNAV